MALVFDAEATGLDVERDKVHCVVVKDYETGVVYRFRPHELDQVKNLFDSAKKLVAHNGIDFDAPLLRNNGIVNIPHSKIVDTLILSRLYYPDRDGHSVEAWGKKLGYPKVEHEEWSVFTEDMLYRCETDVEIQTKIYERLLKERGDHDWSLAERIEHKVAEILSQQEKVGWKFNLEEAKKLVEWLEGELQRLEDKMDFGYYYVNKGKVKKPFKKDGTYTKQVEDWLNGPRESFGSLYDNFNNNYCCFDHSNGSSVDGGIVGGPFGRIEWHPIRLSQREKVANKLLEWGWKPTSYTKKGSPQLTPNKEPCPNLVAMGEIGQDIAYYSLCSHRKGQIEGWIENCREDGRVPSIAIGNSTNTGRMAHRVIANVPKASDKVFLGKEMRGLFTHEKGYTLVGWDAEGLELRVLAHYMNDPEFTEAIVNGSKEDQTDIHNLMLRASEGIVPDRDTVKNCVYAIIYGAGDWKLGTTAGYTKHAKKYGADLRSKWNTRFTKLESLVNRVSKASERGYLKAIDGRKVWMRRDPTGKVMSHKGLNTLIQATGSIIVKTAVCYLVSYVEREGLDATNLIIYHDEDQAEVDPNVVDKYSQLCYKAMDKTEKLYGLKCPLSIKINQGKTWANTH